MFVLKGFPVALREPVAVKGTFRIEVDRLFVVWFHVNVLICLKCKNPLFTFEIQSWRELLSGDTDGGRICMRSGLYDGGGGGAPNIRAQIGILLCVNRDIGT